MKKFPILLAGLGIATAALPAAANAAPWGVDARRGMIAERIDQGTRSGALTRPEAFRLRGELRDLAGLEQRYRYSGGRLDMRERADLDRRCDALSRQVRFEKHDREDRRDHRR